MISLGTQAGDLDSKQNLLSFEMKSNGEGRKHLLTEAQPTLEKVSEDLDIELGNCHYGPVCMNGKEVFKFAVKAVPDVIGSALQKGSISVEEVRIFT